MIIMIDEIFEMVMKEARSRTREDIYLCALCICIEINMRIIQAADSDPNFDGDVCIQFDNL